MHEFMPQHSHDGIIEVLDPTWHTIMSLSWPHAHLYFSMSIDLAPFLIFSLSTSIFFHVHWSSPSLFSLDSTFILIDIFIFMLILHSLAQLYTLNLVISNLSFSRSQDVVHPMFCSMLEGVDPYQWMIWIEKYVDMINIWKNMMMIWLCFIVM